MGYFAAGVLLLIFQAWLIYHGIDHFGKFGTPYVLFATSMLLPILFLIKNANQPTITFQKTSKINAWLWTLVGGSAAIISLGPLKNLFSKIDPSKYSDVVPQIEWLYTRFISGQFPYVPTETVGHKPFPVYMPFHWYPVGISDLLNIESRWSGYILFVGSCLLLGYFIGKLKVHSLLKAIGLLLPHICLWIFIDSEDISLPVSFELPIMAYYLILAIGLLSRNKWVIIFGLMLCVLSRYTLFFWLPLLAYLLWRYEAFKWSIRTWGFVFAIGMITYVVPYMLKEPGILLEGIHWHNGAAKSEWYGYGDPPISWTQERGIYFAAHFKKLFAAFDNDTQVSYMRMIQAGVMLLLLILGIWLDRLKKWHWTTLGLAMLYTTITCFYLFSPLTYRYYYLVVSVLASVLVIGMSPANRTKKIAYGPLLE